LGSEDKVYVATIASVNIGRSADFTNFGLRFSWDLKFGILDSHMQVRFRFSLWDLPIT